MPMAQALGSMLVQDPAPTLERERAPMSVQEQETKSGQKLALPSEQASAMPMAQALGSMSVQEPAPTLERERAPMLVRDQEAESGQELALPSEQGWAPQSEQKMVLPLEQESAVLWGQGSAQ